MTQGAAIVLRTLTTGARAIFRILAQHQLEGDEEGAGMASHTFMSPSLSTVLLWHTAYGSLALRAGD